MLPRQPRTPSHVIGALRAPRGPIGARYLGILLAGAKTRFPLRLEDAGCWRVAARHQAVETDRLASRVGIFYNASPTLLGRQPQVNHPAGSRRRQDGEGKESLGAAADPEPMSPLTPA